MSPKEEWVGEGDSRKDIAQMSDRGVAAMALDVVLRLNSALQRHSDAFREFLDHAAKRDEALIKELPALNRRVQRLEEDRAFGELGPVREEAPSYHDWNAIIERAGKEAGKELSRQVKDPHSRMDSTRARQIAEEAAQGVIEAAKVADDAQAFQTIKTRALKIGGEVVKLVVAAVVGAFLAKWGLDK